MQLITNVIRAKKLKKLRVAYTRSGFNHIPAHGEIVLTHLILHLHCSGPLPPVPPWYFF